MRSIRNWSILLLVVALVAAVFATSCAPQEEETDTTDTTEEEEAPDTTEEEDEATTYDIDLAAADGVTTSATGTFSMEVNGDSATFTLEVDELADVTMAHIHIGEEAGAEGPPAVWLYPTDSQQPQLKEGITNGELASGSFSETDFAGPLEGMTMDDLLAAIDEGRAYVNVHTEANPDGEISGFLP